MCCVAETRHTYPRLERKPAAIPEWDGKSYIIRVPDPAVHSLVPEPYLLRPGLAGTLQGRPTGFHGFVSAWLIYLARPILTGHLLFMQHCFSSVFTQGVGTLPHSYDPVLLFCCWSDSDFISCNCPTLDTDLKCHEVVCHSCANVCKPVEWTEGKNLNVSLSEERKSPYNCNSVKLNHFISFITVVQWSFRFPGRCLGCLISSAITF